VNKVKWFFAVMKVGFENLANKNTYETSENKMKLLAQKYGVNWHKFRE
jgi:hypothetical protein